MSKKKKNLIFGDEVITVKSPEMVVENINEEVNTTKEKTVDELNNISNLQSKLSEYIEKNEELLTENNKLKQEIILLKEEINKLNSKISSSLIEKSQNTQDIKEKEVKDNKVYVNKINTFNGINRGMSGDGYNSWN